MPDALGEPIAPAHAPMLRAAFARADKRTWCYFPPFLCAFSLPPNRVVRVIERAGSVCLLAQRPDHIDFLCPPAPFAESVLESLLDEVKRENGGRLPRILWVDAEDAHRLNDAVFDLREKDAEYVYDPARIAAADGPAFRDLRKHVRRFERDCRAIFRPMTPEDASACHALLRHWRRRQGRKHPFLLDWGYTRAALDGFADWARGDLNGWCVDMDGRVAGFALTGEQRADQAHFFVAKTDPDVPGLSFFLRQQVYRALAGYRRVNDAGDLGLPGLRQFKAKFRPVDRLRVFSAEVRGAL